MYCPMNLLALDTSTETMSVAVQRVSAGVPEVWQHTGPGGVQTSTHLIPVIQRLMAQAELRLSELGAIAFGAGPGSFTGLRTACAVAQGLAFGANVQVLPVDTLLSLAEEARAGHAASVQRFQALALLDARMNEMYVGAYVFDAGRWTRQQDCRLIRPEELIADAQWTRVGNVFTVYGTRLPPTTAPSIAALPTASAMLRLAPALLAAGAAVSAEHALPRYIRDKVAQTTLERAAHKVAL